MLLRSSRSVTSGASRCVLGWGAGSVGSSPTTRYLFPWYSDQMAEVGEVGLVVPITGTLTNFGVLHNITDGNGNSITYTIRVAGSPTALVVTLPSTSGYGANTSVSVPVIAGDLVGVSATKPLGIGKSPRNISTTVDLV